MFKSFLVLTAVAVGELLLLLSGVKSGSAYLKLESTVLTAVVVGELLLAVRGKLRNSLPDVGFHYSLDSCGC